MGTFRWLTVNSPDGAEGVELAGIPATAFITRDLAGDYARLKAGGVVFRGEPKRAGPITMVLFEDTCGNLINLVQPDD